MLVSDLFDPLELISAINNGYVRVQQHPECSYEILNYTEKAVFDKHWTPVTLGCRGLIVDGEHVIARIVPADAIVLEQLTVEQVEELEEALDVEDLREKIVTGGTHPRVTLYSSLLDGPADLSPAMARTLATYIALAADEAEENDEPERPVADLALPVPDVDAAAVWLFAFSGKRSS